MPATYVLFPTVRPKVTEAFLLAQPEVMDASVWVSDGQLFAHVTLSEEARWTSQGLIKACEEELGVGQAPCEIILLAAKRRAA